MQKIKYNDIKVGDMIMEYTKNIGYIISEAVQIEIDGRVFPAFDGDMIGCFKYGGSLIEYRGYGSGCLDRNAEFFKLGGFSE